MGWFYIATIKARLVSQNKYYAAGRHEEILQLEGATGILFAELVTAQGNVVRKMLAVVR